MPVDISIVVPTFNRPALLKRCLSALMIQAFPPQHYEVIVVSDGPDPVTRAVVEHGAPPGGQPAVRYVALPRKKGPAAARNAGWRLAAGRLIAFTDDDCVPQVRWLRHAWDAYRNQDMVALAGRVVVPVPARPTDYERNVSRLEEADFVTANCFCTRRALERVKGFDERFPCAWREDSDLQFRFLEHRIPVESVPAACIIHPVRPSRWGVSLNEQRRSMYNALLYKVHPRLYRCRIQAHPPWHYYGAVLAFLALLLGGLLGAHQALVTASLVGWLAFSASFMWRRLEGCSRKGTHLLEMAVTSLCIPFLSIFWRLVGAFKYKIFFL